MKLGYNVTYGPCWCFRLLEKKITTTPEQMEVFSQERTLLILHHSVPSGRILGFGKGGEKAREEIKQEEEGDDSSL